MPELRIDPLSGLRTIVAGDRAGRPGGDFRVQPHPEIDAATDPFCAGNEHLTPPELYSRPSVDGGGWSVRVVPNLYPALAAPETGPPGPDGPGSAGSGSSRPGRLGSTSPGTDPLAASHGEADLFAARPAIGAHEVIVNAPDAVPSLGLLEPDQVIAAMDVWRERMREHAGASYVHVIVNEGREAGASLPHTHAQLYALDFVPAAIARERERFTAYGDRTQGRNLLEDLLQEEVRRSERIVAIDEEAVALCPFASRVPFQLQIVPRRPRASFAEDGPLGGRMLHEVLRRLARALGGTLPPLNLWVRSAPAGAERFCWRIDLLPRLTNLAGLEMGAGVHLNVLAPERAALLLREAAAVEREQGPR